MGKMKSLIDYLDVQAGGFDYAGSYHHQYSGTRPMQEKIHFKKTEAYYDKPATAGLTWLESVRYCYDAPFESFPEFCDSVLYISGGVGLTQGELKAGDRILITSIGIFEYLGSTIMGSLAFNEVHLEDGKTVIEEGSTVYVSEGKMADSVWTRVTDKWIMVNPPKPEAKKNYDNLLECMPYLSKAFVMKQYLGLTEEDIAKIEEDEHPPVKEPKDKWGPRTHPEPEEDQEDTKDDAYERAMRII